MAGDPGTPLPKKLGITEGARLALLASPAGFARCLDPLPPGVRVRTHARGRLDVIVFFATRRRELERRLPVMARALEPDGGLWVAWPQRASGVATDLTFEPVQTIGLEAGLVDDTACAIDETWSGLRFLRRRGDRASSNGA